MTGLRLGGHPDLPLGGVGDRRHEENFMTAKNVTEFAG
jgi:hypothetical protein